PARVPNHVLTDADYAIVIDPAQPRERRIEAFVNRTSWNQPLHGSTAAQMEQMVRIFGSMGLVEVREGVRGDPAFPDTMMVASYGPEVAPADTRSPVEQAPTLKLAAVGAAEAHPKARPRALPRGSNFASHEDAGAAPLPVRHGKKRD
ncbi:MAG: hypothetical protein MUE46_15590, partial [Xanthomonadales bacterium]|nr:hypothetical protein [Xanthomonadales bacterium]